MVRHGSPLLGTHVAGWAIVSCQGILSSVALEELVLDESGAPVDCDGAEMRVLDLLSDATKTDDPIAPALHELVARLPSLLADRAHSQVEARAPRNAAALERGRVALKRATAGRRAWLSQQLESGDLEPKLRRMFQSWEERLDHELTGKLQDLETRGAFHVAVEYLGAVVIDGRREE